jgi:hypothetical protein
MIGRTLKVYAPGPQCRKVPFMVDIRMERVFLSPGRHAALPRNRFIY